MRTSYRILFLAAVLLLSLAAAVPSAQAAVFIPTKLTDSADGACDADCSLREAILAANDEEGPDFIVLNAGTYSLSRAGAGEDLGATGDLDIREDLAIVGRGAASTVIDANRIDRAIDVPEGVRLELVSVTVTDGLVTSAKGGGLRVAGDILMIRSLVSGNEAAGSGGSGGGIAGVGPGSLMNLDQSTFLGNRSAEGGGGVYSEGVVNLLESTLSGNRADSVGGGGLYATDDAGGLVSGSTIAFNTATAGKGGGVFVASVPFISTSHPQFENTIIAANTAPSDRDCSGAAVSLGHNLLGDGTGCLAFSEPGDLKGTTAAPLNPKLLPLEATGGPTPVHRPDTGSPAIDHGGACNPVDQRGAARSATACEIGSVEVTGQCISGGPILCLNQGRFEVKVTWTTSTGTGAGQAIQLTDESGFFTFFDPSNVELTVKILNGCGLSRPRYWVFMSGLTNVGVQVTVTDTKTGQVKTYNNPRDRTFAPVLDTNAFNTCP